MADKALAVLTVGQGKMIPVDHAGPTSYATGGETLGSINNQTGITVLGLGTLDDVLGSGSVSISGNYGVIVQPVGKGEQKTFKLIWVTATAGIPSTTQVAAAVDLSAETVKLVYIGR
jgi:hypothetical protein